MIMWHFHKVRAEEMLADFLLIFTFHASSPWMTILQLRDIWTFCIKLATGITGDRWMTSTTERRPP